jgi:hypothetical protein
LVLVLVAAAVVAVGAMTTAVVLAHSRGGGNQPAAAPPPVVGTDSSAPSPVTSFAADPTPFGYLPLWPFAGQADAQAWQAAYRSGGHQPWHLDAGRTALSFTQGYLGYTNVDEVVNTRTSGQQGWVSVGFDDPDGRPTTSAVLHLVRLGTGTDAPWEVVGTKDTTLTLTTPAYGSTVRSPVTTGGRITGVDESLRVQIRQLDRPDAVSRTAGVPAGGDRARWTIHVPFTAPGDTLTIAVSTGGHIADVERFAITGVRT